MCACSLGHTTPTGLAGAHAPSFDFASLSTFTFLSYAGAPHPRQVSPPGALPRPRALPELLKSPAAPGAAARPSPTRKRTLRALAARRRRPPCLGPPPPHRHFASSLLFLLLLLFLACLLAWPFLPAALPPASRGRRASPPSDAPPGISPAAPWWSQGGSNSRPPACKAGALPAELWPLG